MSIECFGTDHFREYGPISRARSRREMDEDGEFDDEDGGPSCPEHPNHPAHECELCAADEEEEIQDDEPRRTGADLVSGFDCLG